MVQVGSKNQSAVAKRARQVAANQNDPWTEAMEWCHREWHGEADPLMLRSSDLQPWAVRTLNPRDVRMALSVDWNQAVRLVTGLRRRELGPGPFPHRAGRIVCVDPGRQLSDGGPEAASLGWFDADNVPPWDTWISYDKGLLRAWVPARAAPMVQQGIEACGDSSIFWEKP